MTEYELRGEAATGYWERWAVEPPAVGSTYRVWRDEWQEDLGEKYGHLPGRTIYEYELIASV